MNYRIKIFTEKRIEYSGLFYTTCPAMETVDSGIMETAIPEMQNRIILEFESHWIHYSEPPNPNGGVMRNQMSFRCLEPYSTMNLQQYLMHHYLFYFIWFDNIKWLYWVGIICLGVKSLRVDVKRIQATPSLSGEDAKRIMLQVSAKPSNEAIKRNEALLKLRKNILRVNGK